MNEDDLLKGAASWQWKPRPAGRRLGDELAAYLEQHCGAFEKNSPIVDAFQRIVPAAMAPYCRLDKRVGNTLYVQVAAGPYRHQLQMVSGDWLAQLKQACPRCGITTIKLVPMRSGGDR